MTPYPKESARPPVDAERLQEGIRALMKEGYGAEVEVLREFLTKAPGGEAALFRPSRLKPLERRVALELCLAATRRGLLDLSWRVMCPYCRGNREIVTALSDLREKVHCKSCAIAYDASFDTNVEVLFSVASSVRPVERAAYCIGGPHLAPHVEAQIVVAPGGVEEIGREIPPGCYRLVSLQAPLAVLADAEVGLDVTIDENGLHATPANEWRFRNRLASTATVRVERRDGTPDVVTAAEVTTLAAFRDQFSSEVLAPGVELAVRQVALLFTDLRGSTRMYRERGDAPSYAEVRRHFSLVSQIVADGGGAVVKTIGDAVMAAFHDPADAVRAALEIQRRESNLTTRIGVHAGPAIVVNANDRLDYFGRTVNLAARLQKQSQGRDVVITEALLEDSRVRESLAGVATDSFRAPVPDVEESMRLVRVRPV